MGKHKEPQTDRHLDGQCLLSPFQPEPEGEAVEVLEGGRIRPHLGHSLGQTRLDASQRVGPERPAASENQDLCKVYQTWEIINKSARLVPEELCSREPAHFLGPALPCQDEHLQMNACGMTTHTIIASDGSMQYDGL